MPTISKEKLKRMQYILQLPNQSLRSDEHNEALSIIEELLAQPEQPEGEPVAWIWKYQDGSEEVVFVKPHRLDPEFHDIPASITPLFTHPAPFTPAPLEGEPFGYVHTVFNEHFHLPNIEVFNRSKDLPTNSLGYFPVYLRPIIFTPITAEDVTDEMTEIVAASSAVIGCACYWGDSNRKEIIAVAVNAYMGANK